MRAWYRNIDYGILFAWIGLVLVGLVAIYSTTHGPAAEYLLDSVKRNFERQSVWAGVSVVVLGVCMLLPVRFYQGIAFPAYLIGLALMALTVAIGKEVNGAKSWLEIGPVAIQVSELAKVGTVLAVAQLLSLRRPNSGNLRYALGATVLLLIPAVIVLLQNDTGTALVFVGLIPIMLFWSGLPLHVLALMLAPAVAGYFAIVYPPAAYGFGVLFALGMFIATREKWMAGVAALATLGTAAAAGIVIHNVLQPHQIARIVSFTNPEAEEFRSGVGFHLVQSKAAIGSGGLTGKGFMEGTQTQGAYVPEQSTDFVFSIIGEEFGFVGALVVLLLYGLLLVRLVNLGTRVKHPFVSMVAAGAAGVFLIHLFVNIGMVTGLLPVIGIPLPFISYGGAALVANSLMLAIIVALYVRRDDFSIYGF